MENNRPQTPYFQASKSLSVVDFGANRKSLWDFLTINRGLVNTVLSCTPFLTYGELHLA